MVRARLHIICGNCGGNDSFKLRIGKEIDDDSEKERTSAAIYCENCGTIHFLDCYMDLVER